MPIRVKCPAPGCGETFQVGDEMVGETVECPFCGSAVVVKQSAGEAGERTEQVPEDQGTAEGPVHHPARQVCPNCGAVLGVRTSICPQCGADIRTGGVTARRSSKRRNWRPLLMALGGAAVLIALIAVGIFAVSRLTGGKKEEPGPQQPVVQEPAEAPEEEPKVPEVTLRLDLPADLKQALLDNEKRAAENAVAFKEKLRGTLQKVGGAPAGAESAGAWADLYRFYADRGMHAEAEMCWYRAAMLAPDDPDVNQKLGRTETFAGMAVTPEQKDFLDSLRPKATIINSSTELENTTATVDGRTVSLAPGQEVELEVRDEVLEVHFAAEDQPDKTVRRFALPVKTGLAYEVEIKNTAAAPFLSYQALGALYQAVANNREARGVRTRRDSDGNLIWARAGGLVLEQVGDTPLRIQMDEGNARLTIFGYLRVGDPFGERGSHGLAGDEAQPLRIQLIPQQKMAVVQDGTYFGLRLDLAEQVWGALAVAHGHLAAEWARKTAAARVEQVEAENALLNARGSLVRQDELHRRFLERLEGLPDELAAERELFQRASEMAVYTDRVRALGLQNRQQRLYLNWPRYRRAMAAALAESQDEITARLNKIPVKSKEDEDEYMPGVRPGVAEPYLPTPIELSPAQKTRIRLQVAPLFGDDYVLNLVRRNWEEIGPEARVSALLALEMVGSSEAVSLMARCGSETRELDLMQMVLMSLGTVGTADAVEAFDQIPAVSGKVRTATRAARVVAGDPEALDAVPGFLKEANGEQKEQFLWLISQTDTPGALLAMGDAVVGCDDPYDAQRMAAAFVRMGGITAAHDLARLMDVRGDRFPGLVAHISAHASAPVLRRIVDSLGRGSESMADALQNMGSDLSWELLELFAERGSSGAVRALLQKGTPEAVEAATKGADAVDAADLRWVRSKWLVGQPEEARWRWRAGVPEQAANAFLARAYREAKGRDKLTAFVILRKLGRQPDVADIVELARNEPEPAKKRIQATGAEDEQFGQVAAAARISPPAFEEPEGMPRSADVDFGGELHLCVLGLLRDVGDARALSLLRELIEGYHHGEFKAPAMVALAQAGGESERAFLRNIAAQRKSTYADLSEWSNELESRIAAANALAMVQDPGLLELVPDMLQEQPPAAEAVQETVTSYEDYQKWWERKFYVSVCRALARTCRRRSPRQMGAGRDVAGQIVSALRETIEKYGADETNLTEAQMELRNEAIAAFGRVADWDEPSHRLVINLLSEIVAERDRDERRRLGRKKWPGLEELRMAVLDAVAHIAARQMGDEKLLDTLRLMEDSTGRDEFLKLVKNMATYAPPRFFEMLEAMSELIDEEERASIVQAVPPDVQVSGAKQAQWVAAVIEERSAVAFSSQMPMLAGVGEIREMSEEEIEQYVDGIIQTHGYGPRDMQEVMRDATQEIGFRADFGDLREIVMEKLQKMSEEGGHEPYRKHPWRERVTARKGADEFDLGEFGEGMQGMTEEERREFIEEMEESRPDMMMMGVEENPYVRVDRPGAQRWVYSLSQLKRQWEREQEVWRLAELLFQSNPSAIAQGLDSVEWLMTYPIGPFLMLHYAEASPSDRDRAIAKLKDTLTEGRSTAKMLLSGRGIDMDEMKLPSPEAYRSAAAALSHIGTPGAAQALWEGLVGPDIRRLLAMGETPQGQPPMMEMLKGMGMEPRTSPEVHCARALGSMGRGELLTRALDAGSHEFFMRNRGGVQKAALEGMAYMPSQTNPVQVLANLLRRATNAQLKQAAAQAISVAFHLPSVEQRLGEGR